jgi:hypothetical protein
MNSDWVFADASPLDRLTTCSAFGFAVLNGVAGIIKSFYSVHSAIL